MKLLILILFSSLSLRVLAFGANSLKANKRSINCLPANASSPGTSLSLDFGKSHSLCSGFNCNGGYSVSGSTCVASATANVVCASSLECLVHPNSSSLSVGNSFSRGFDIYGCYYETFTVATKWNCSAAYITTNFNMYADISSGNCSAKVVQMSVYTSDVATACTSVP